MTTSEFIAQRRKELGLTLEEVGKACGVGKSTVKKWEDGFISNMKRDKIADLAKILNVSPLDLIGEVDDRKKEQSIPELSETDCLALELFQQLDDESKKMFIQLMQDRLK